MIPLILLILLILLCKGGEKVLVHFIQDSPGDHLPLEEISKALGISAKAEAGQMPVVRHPINIHEKIWDSHYHHFPFFISFLYFLCSPLQLWMNFKLHSEGLNIMVSLCLLRHTGPMSVRHLFSHRLCFTSAAIRASESPFHRQFHTYYSIFMVCQCLCQRPQKPFKLELWSLSVLNCT